MLTSKLLFYCTVALCSQEYAHVGQAGNIHVVELRNGTKFLLEKDFRILQRYGLEIERNTEFGEADEVEEVEFQYFNKGDCLATKKSFEKYGGFYGNNYYVVREQREDQEIVVDVMLFKLDGQIIKVLTKVYNAFEFIALDECPTKAVCERVEE